MPQKNPVKKTVKSAVKKALPGGRQAAQAKKAQPKAVKKALKKPATKSAKPVVKTKSKTVAPKKAASKPVAKPVKTLKKTAPAVAKPEHKSVIHKYDKQIKSPMSKQKKQEPVKKVRLPKITTKASVPYQPSYKSLEQRQEPVKLSEPLVRYSDTELTEFRELIQRKLNSAKKELAYLQGLITRKDDMGGDESENRYMTMEDGSISMEREQLSQMASRQITYIDHLEKALIRIENKTYGICRVTGRLIDKARLRAVPHATLSLEAKLGLVKAGE